jgi:hypothetical protein
MTDFQKAASLLDDGKIHIDDLGQDRNKWVGQSREAEHDDDVFNYYFCILKNCNDSYFSRDWVVVEVMCNTIIFVEGCCWLYISIRDYENNISFIEKHIPIEDGGEYYSLSKEFVSTIDYVSRDWLKNLNTWLQGDYLEA